jgi:hypothetical protein
MINILNIIFIFIIIGASIGQILSRGWRLSLGFLAAQYLSVFWFVQTIWPLSLAIIKLITGLFVCLILATAKESYASFINPESSWPQGRIFRSLAAGLVILTTLALSSQAPAWLGVNNSIGIWASLLLMGLGVLQLGITTQPMRVIIALLTFLSGFEIIYAFVETSALVAAMLVLINLGFSLVGIYLSNSDFLERNN